MCVIVSVGFGVERDCYTGNRYNNERAKCGNACHILYRERIVMDALSMRTGVVVHHSGNDMIAERKVFAVLNSIRHIVG